MAPTKNRTALSHVRIWKVADIGRADSCATRGRSRTRSPLYATRLVSLSFPSFTGAGTLKVFVFGYSRATAANDCSRLVPVSASPGFFAEVNEGVTSLGYDIRNAVRPFDQCSYRSVLTKR